MSAFRFRTRPTKCSPRKSCTSLQLEFWWRWDWKWTVGPWRVIGWRQSCWKLPFQKPPKIRPEKPCPMAQGEEAGAGYFIGEAAELAAMGTKERTRCDCAESISSSKPSSKSKPSPKSFDQWNSKPCGQWKSCRAHGIQPGTCTGAEFAWCLWKRADVKPL